MSDPKKCCYLECGSENGKPCDKLATRWIGTNEYDATYSCEEHVEQLRSDAKGEVVHPL